MAWCRQVKSLNGLKSIRLNMLSTSDDVIWSEILNQIISSQVILDDGNNSIFVVINVAADGLVSRSTAAQWVASHICIGAEFEDANTSWIRAG